MSILFDENFQTNKFDTKNKYDRSTLVDHSSSNYDLSTLVDESLETNQFYTDITIENNVHANNVENDVHDIDLSSMRAHDEFRSKETHSKWSFKCSRNSKYNGTS